MGRSANRSAVVASMLLLMACSPGAIPRAVGDIPAGRASAPAPTLVVVTRSELDTVASKPLLARGAGLGDGPARRLFNAGLAINDGQGVPRPYLGEALPELKTPSWQVLPDGRMETTYRLRSGLTWHDGTPLTADNRWTGANHGNWSNPAFDALYDSFATTLERPERVRLVAQMAKIYTEELAAISLHYSPNVIARVAALEGPELFAPDSLPTWNVHLWHWRSRGS